MLIDKSVEMFQYAFIAHNYFFIGQHSWISALVYNLQKGQLDLTGID